MKELLVRIRSIAVKEYKHIARDPFTLAVALVLPLIFVGFFGFIIDLDYKDMSVHARDNDQSSMSRRFLNMFSSSGYFRFEPLHYPAQADEAANENRVAVVMVIQKGFGEKIKRADPSDPARVQFLIDGSDNSKAGILSAYISGITQRAEAEFIKNAAGEPLLSADLVRTRFLFNPELNSHWFIVPALTTIIISLLAILLTALTIAKEWENGSMELLLSTPVRPIEIVAGKLIPYFALSFFNILLVFVLALLVFKIPFAGSFFWYMVASVIFVIGALGLGILISVATRSQQAAIQFAFAIGLLPGMVFTGFIFPIENMPLFFQYLTMLFPQRWFLEISRTLFLSAAPARALIVPFAGLLVFMALMITLSVKRFKTDVEP